MIASKVFLPLFKEVIFDLGWFYIPLAIIIIIGSSNAVNLTDGLDGLAIIPVIMVIGSFALISYFVGNVFYANYLHIPYIVGTGEIAIIGSAIVGVLWGFYGIMHLLQKYLWVILVVYL